MFQSMLCSHYTIPHWRLLEETGLQDSKANMRFKNEWSSIFDTENAMGEGSCLPFYYTIS